MYIYFLEQRTSPTPERAVVIAALRSFQQRQRGSAGYCTTFTAPQAEVVAFGSAVILYCRLVDLALPYSAPELKMKHLVLNFQQRYLGMLQAWG